VFDNFFEDRYLLDPDHKQNATSDNPSGKIGSLALYDFKPTFNPFHLSKIFFHSLPSFFVKLHYLHFAFFSKASGLNCVCVHIFSLLKPFDDNLRILSLLSSFVETAMN
jgi:hypothetical protein